MHRRRPRADHGRAARHRPHPRHPVHQGVRAVRVDEVRPHLRPADGNAKARPGRQQLHAQRAGGFQHAVAQLLAGGGQHRHGRGGVGAGDDLRVGRRPDHPLGHAAPARRHRLDCRGADADVHGAGQPAGKSIPDRQPVLRRRDRRQLQRRRRVGRDQQRQPGAGHGADRVLGRVRPAEPVADIGGGGAGQGDGPYARHCRQGRPAG